MSVCHRRDGVPLMKELETAGLIQSIRGMGCMPQPLQYSFDCRGDYLGRVALVIGKPVS